MADADHGRGDNPLLADLSVTMAMVHRALLKILAKDPASEGEIADTHSMIRRIISRQTAHTANDVRVILQAAQAAIVMDPEFEMSEPGSYVDLTRKAIAAIDRIHSKRAATAQALMDTLMLSSKKSA